GPWNSGALWRLPLDPSFILCIRPSRCLPDTSSLSFRTEPVSVVQKQGGSVQLRCTARPASAHVSWLFEGQPLQPGVPSGVELAAGSLTLPALQPSQQGSYQCLAQTHSGAILSQYARVTIADIEEFSETHRRSVVAAAGSTAMIECSLPASNPPAMPRYRVKGMWIEESTGRGTYLLLPSGNLQIISVSSTHQGMYKCGAYNSVTRENRVEPFGTKLVVKVSLTFILNSEGPSPVRIAYPTSPVNVSVEQSMSQTLECVLAGSPSAAVKWTFNGKAVSLGGRNRMLDGNLFLMDVAPADAGSYRCMVETRDVVLVSANYTVNVLEPPSLVDGLSDKAVSSGHSVRFTCLARGNPTPSVTWLYNSHPVTPSPRLQISGSSLRISMVTAQEQGMYQCLLDNRIGSVQSTAKLTVLSDQNSSPVILSAPLGGTFRDGDAVTLSCNATGQPLPIIRWYNAAGPIATHPALLLQPPQAEARAPGGTPLHLTMSRPGSSTLYIQSITTAHAGQYTCEATNELGSVQAEAVLVVEPQLTPTMGVDMESLPSVHPMQRDGDELFLPVEEGEGLDDTLGPPKEGASDHPTPEAPIIISSPQTHKPDIYDLEWKPVRDADVPINAYFVKYRKVDEMGNVVGSWHTVRVPGSENSLRLNDLEPSSLYEVLMVARSAAGEGQPAMLTFRTGKEKSPTKNNPSNTPSVSLPVKTHEDKMHNTHFGVVLPDRAVPEAPDRPTISMATESSVYVTWIPRANGGTPITLFRVEYRKQGRSAEWVVAADNISPLKLSVEVRNLEPGSMYRFRVVAMNMFGESPHSATSRPYQVSPASSAFSKRPVSGPHISITDPVSDTQIMLRWTYTPSINNNTPIQGFYIYYRPTDSDNDSDYKRDVVEGNRHWHLIGQLQPETSYDIKMQCFNDGGESDYSNVMICETKGERVSPGIPSQHPITPPGVYPQEPPAPAGGLLYLIVGCVLGVMVFILLAFIAMCLWKNRQQSSIHKYDPPGYLYQPAEMNGHVLEYTTLPGTSRINGGVHAGYGHTAPMLPQGCHHLHHKLPNGLPLLNGTAALYQPGHAHTHDASLPHEHPHHLHNGGGVYTALPQTDSSDCMSCQNLCNNNRYQNKRGGGVFTAYQRGKGPELCVCVCVCVSVHACVFGMCAPLASFTFRHLSETVSSYRDSPPLETLRVKSLAQGHNGSK
uniref:Cell adhesion associated, oncogene regulated n=1 Tax=Denticeps clupeoides TaxID=299321 RepID=A0AAY4E304_9TELE